MFSPIVLSLLILLMAAWTPPARAALANDADQIVERGYLRDPGAGLRITDVEAQAFTPYTGPLAHGNSGVPVWLRLSLRAQPSDRQHLVLVVQPATVSDVQIYWQAADGHWQRHDTGGRVAFDQRARRDLSFAVSFPVGADGPSAIYVRLHTPTAIVHVRALTPEQARDFDVGVHVLAGLYFGLAFVLTILAAALWWSTRDPLWGAAMMFDAATLLLGSMPLGMFSKYVIPGLSDTLPSLFALAGALHLTVGSLFFSLLATALKAPRWVGLGYLIVLPLWLVWLPLLATGQLGAVLSISNLFVLIVTLWGVLAVLTIRAEDRTLVWLYRALMGVLIAYLIYWVVPLLLRLPASPLNLYPTLPTNLFSMVMVVLILARRTVLAAQARVQLEQDKLQAEQRLQLEQAHHQETAGMMSMIMHETKNPLAAIRMASELLSSGRVYTAEDQAKRFRNIQDAVDGIDSVLQRCLDTDRLEQGALEVMREPTDVAECLRHWLSLHPQAARIFPLLPPRLDAEIDVQLLILMLGNLVDNALKYSPPAAAVTLELRGIEHGLQVQVRNPVGRAGRPDPEQLFQKYYRAPAAQYRNGTGLGLYWVRRVAELLGGQVQYHPGLDEVLFTLEIPG